MGYKSHISDPEDQPTWQGFLFVLFWVAVGWLTFTVTESRTTAFFLLVLGGYFSGILISWGLQKMKAE